VLPVWTCLAIAIELAAPSAGFMWALPLLGAGIGLAVGPLQTRAAARWISLAVAALAGALWIPSGFELYRFLFSTLGRERVVTPVWLFPAFLLFCGLVVALPWAAALCGRSRTATMRQLALFTLGLVIVFPMACNAPAYTTDRPLRRHVRYVQDETTGRAAWEIGGNEPALDVGPGSGLEWVAPLRPPAPVLEPFRHPFVYHADASARVPPPAEVSAGIEVVDGLTRFTATVVPSEPGLRATLMLPPGLMPQRPSHAGVLDARGAWRATYIGVPAEGTTFSALVEGGLTARLADARVIVEAARLPDPAGVWPAWLLTGTTTWTRRSYWVLPLGMPE
jgi:hypothetical protein